MGYSTAMPVGDGRRWMVKAIENKYQRKAAVPTRRRPIERGPMVSYVQAAPAPTGFSATAPFNQPMAIRGEIGRLIELRAEIRIYGGRYEQECKRIFDGVRSAATLGDQIAGIAAMRDLTNDAESKTADYAARLDSLRLQVPGEMLSEPVDIVSRLLAAVNDCRGWGWKLIGIIRQTYPGEPQTEPQAENHSKTPCDGCGMVHAPCKDCGTVDLAD